MIGQTLQDRYQITARIGKGAMGTVYRAADTQTGQEVGVKVIARELAFDEAMLERFRREGEALRQLRHPNIVGFVDAFQHDEHYVIVMEYVPGGSLHELIKQGPLPIDRARQIALDLCDALIRAHRLGIIHRDIKPENILLAEDGTPRLTDFGVARLAEGSRLTGTGAQLGTPYYMSPEAWEGKELDAQADIWSLGVVLYEMLSGEVPFGGETLVAVMNKVLTAPLPELKATRPDVPDGLVRVIRRTLARDRTTRYQSVRQLAADLEQGAPTPAIAGSKAAPTALIRLGLGAGTIGLLAVIAVVYGLSWPKPSAATPAPSAPAVSQFADTPVDTPQPTPALTERPEEMPPPRVIAEAGLGVGSSQVSEKDGMVMVYVPAGEFTMGSSDSATNADSDEKPLHTVYLEAFWIDQTEVTNAMYALCVSAGHCPAPSSRGSRTRSNYYGDLQYSNYPVIYVSWGDAKAYCQWAGRRLPTEAEWEKAARGTDGRKYPWGTFSPVPPLLNFNGGVGDTTEAGVYPSGASPYGALDMAGNVWEWVSDWYDAGYYGRSPSANPQGPPTGNFRVLRGGSWTNVGSSVRAANRYWQEPGRGNDLIGFRCSLSP